MSSAEVSTVRHVVVLLVCAMICGFADQFALTEILAGGVFMRIYRHFREIGAQAASS